MSKNEKNLSTTAKLILGAVGVVLVMLVAFMPGSTAGTPVNNNNPVTVPEAAPEQPLPPKATSIRNIDLTKNKRVIMIDDVVDGSILAKAQTLSALAAESLAPIYIVISSPGGSVLDGGMFISAMRASKAPVYTVCVQLCASMAAHIHQYGTKRLMINNSILMFHPASGQLQGTLEQMHSRLSFISRYVQKMNANVANRSGITLAEYNNLTGHEYWIEAEDALVKNFADEIVSVTLPPQNLSLEQLIPRQKTENNPANDIRGVTN